MKCGITLVMKSCGDANAWWDPPTLTETLCYEMAKDFVELYQRYMEKAAASPKKTSANELMTRNAKRIHLVGSESSGNQTEKFELKTETAVFFAQPARNQAAVHARPQSRK